MSSLAIHTFLDEVESKQGNYVQLVEDIRTSVSTAKKAGREHVAYRFSIAVHNDPFVDPDTPRFRAKQASMAAQQMVKEFEKDGYNVLLNRIMGHGPFQPEAEFRINVRWKNNEFMVRR